MRKELVIYISTTEKESELQMRNDLIVKDHIVLTIEGFKCSISKDELVSAIYQLNAFDMVNGLESKEDKESSGLNNSVDCNG